MLKRKKTKASKRAKVMLAHMSEAREVREKIEALEPAERAQIAALAGYIYQMLFGNNASIRNVFIAPEDAPAVLLEKTVQGIEDVRRQNGRQMRLVAREHAGPGASAPDFVKAHIRRVCLALQLWKLLPGIGLAPDSAHDALSAWSLVDVGDGELAGAFAAIREIEQRNEDLGETAKAPTAFRKLDDGEWLGMCHRNRWRPAA